MTGPRRAAPRSKPHDWPATVEGHHRLMAADMTEAVLQERVRQLCLWNRWRYYHTFQARHSPRGFPDVVAVRGGRLIFAELKREKGKLTTDQTAWIEDLQDVTTANVHLGAEGARAQPEVYIWRPYGLFDGSIEAVLR